PRPRRPPPGETAGTVRGRRRARGTHRECRSGRGVEAGTRAPGGGSTRPFRRGSAMSLTVALSKGKLLGGSESLFRRAGLPFPDDPGRRLGVALDGLVVWRVCVRDA